MVVAVAVGGLSLRSNSTVRFKVKLCCVTVKNQLPTKRLFTREDSTLEIIGQERWKMSTIQTHNVTHNFTSLCRELPTNANMQGNIQNVGKLFESKNGVPMRNFRLVDENSSGSVRTLPEFSASAPDKTVMTGCVSCKGAETTNIIDSRCLCCSGDGASSKQLCAFIGAE